MRLQQLVISLFMIAASASGIALVGCSDRSTQSRTVSTSSDTPDDSADSNVSTSKSAEQITGTNLTGIRVLVESISAATKKYTIQATTNKAEKMVLSKTNAGQFEISDVVWSFSGTPTCPDSGQDRFSRICRLSGDQAATLQVSVKIIFKRSAEDLSSPVIDSQLQPAAPDSSGKKLLFMILMRAFNSPNGFDGDFSNLGTSGSLENIDSTCQTVFGNGGGNGNYTWKGMVKMAGLTWSQRMVVGSNPIDGLIMSEDAVDMSKLQFTRDLSVLAMSAGGIVPTALMPAGTQFTQGLQARTNELRTSESYGTIGGATATSMWFGEGCAGWTTNGTATSPIGNGLVVSPIENGGGASNSPRPCNTKTAVACLGIER